MNKTSAILLPLLFLVSACSNAETVETEAPFPKLNVAYVHESAFDQPISKINRLEHIQMGVTATILNTDEATQQLKQDMRECAGWSEFLFIINMGYSDGNSLDDMIRFNKESLVEFHVDYIGYVNSERLIRDFYRMRSDQTLKQQQIRAVDWCMEDKKYWRE